MLNKDSAGFHLELFRNEDAIVSALRDEGLVHPDFKEAPKKIEESISQTLADIDKFIVDLEEPISQILSDDEFSVGLEEKTTDVRAHASRSKKGKAFNVRQHDRKVNDFAKFDNSDFGLGKKQEEKLLKIFKNNRISGKNKDAISMYAMNSEDINGLLRYGEVRGEKHVRKLIFGIDRALKVGGIVKKPIYVYRGVDRKLFWKAKSDGVFVDKGFVSASASRYIAKGFGKYLVRILLPAGTTARYIGHGEYEALLQRNSKFKIVSRNKNTIDAVYIGVKQSNTKKVIEAVGEYPSEYSKFTWKDGDVEFENELSEAVQLVKAYARIRKGKREFVRQYNRDVDDINYFLEVTTNVRAQTRHSKKGKVFNVKAHEREIDAVDTYRQVGHDLNRILRSGRTTGPLKATSDEGVYLKNIAPLVRNLDSALDGSRLSTDVTLYRGRSFKTDPKLKIGTIITDAGFASFSNDMTVASDFAKGSLFDKKKVDVVFRYLAKKGSKTYKVPKVEGYDEEGEFLLPRNAKFVVRSTTAKRIKSYGGEEYNVQLVNVTLMSNIAEAMQLVKAYARIRKGKREFVHQYNRDVDSVRIIGASKEGEQAIRELLSQHNPQVIASIPSITIMPGGKFRKLIADESGWTLKESGEVAGWYDENTSAITLHKENMFNVMQNYPGTQKLLKGVLDHELGHAAYYHSPKYVDWIKAHKDKKFDRFTWYSKTNDAEAFAESFLAYVASNGKAKNARYKKVFDVVKSVVAAVNPKRNYYGDILKGS